MRFALLLTAIILVAGCTTQAPPPEAAGPDSSLAGPVVTAAGRIAMDVPVDIYLIGATATRAVEIQAALQPIVADHSAFTGEHTIPQSPAEATYIVEGPDSSPANGLVPRAIYRVHALTIGPELAAFVETQREEDGLINASAVEDWLAARLASVDPAPDANLTSLIILETGLTGHEYRYHGNVGWRGPVRTFGERYGFIAWDPYANVDPWVGDAEAHHRPITGDSIPIIKTWVERATHIRVLQMPIFPPSLRDCHAVTILLAVRGTTITPALLGLQRWQDAIDAGRLKEHWSELVSGQAVHVDLHVIQLPQEDPALDAASREHGARESMALWLDRNFESYHVAHDGCEPYLSFVVYGDLTDQRTVSNGVASYYGYDGRRISFSSISELTRFQTEVLGYNATLDEQSNFDRVGPGANPAEWFNWVVSHETGHLFGQAHPNYADLEDGSGFIEDPAFASTWNVMGYQMRRSMTDYGAVDDTNLARNRAGWALRDAVTLGLEDTPEFALAMQALGEYRWQDALQTIAPHVLEARASASR